MKDIIIQEKGFDENFGLLDVDKEQILNRNEFNI
jgi:hypothetical protein